jgi:Recombination endonuclease VII
MILKQCKNGCGKEIVGRSPRALYCSALCKRQAEIARRALARTGTKPAHRGYNDGRSSDRRAASLRTKYGITLDQYQSLLDKQNGGCAICGKTPEQERKNLAVDHNHVTGEVRGLLCFHCNHKKVGRWRDGTILRKIADYVDQGTGWFVPNKVKPRKRK